MLPSFGRSTLSLSSAIRRFGPSRQDHSSHSLEGPLPNSRCLARLRVLRSGGLARPAASWPTDFITELRHTQLPFAHTGCGGCERPSIG